jgi:hypothetical protein
MRIRSAEKLSYVQDGWRDGLKQLGDDNKWKRFGDYWRKQNVETTRESPSITLGYEEKGEENLEYHLPLAGDTQNKIIVCTVTATKLCTTSFGQREMDTHTTVALSSQDNHHDCSSCHPDSHVHNQESRYVYRTHSFALLLRRKEPSTILAMKHSSSLRILPIPASRFRG